MFLRAYDDSKHYSPSLLKAVLRLSVKYEADFLRQRLIFYLTGRYWINIEDFSSPRNVNILPGDLIQLVRDVHIPILLPSAFYEAALLSSADLDSIENEPSAAEGYKGLSKEDWMTVHRGREKLQDALDRHVFQHLALVGSSRECTDPENCRSSRMEIVDKFYTGWIQRPDVLGITSNKPRWVSGLRSLCPKCVDVLEGSLQESHPKVWMETPGYFRLPSWEILRRKSFI